MKNLNTYINEKLVITHYKSYSCAPKTKQELRDIIKERLEKDPDANLNDINVSNITHTSDLFWGLDPGNIDISEWDVSNVEDMHDMFYCCDYFNSDLSNWDVSKVINMYCLFNGCKKFNSDLNNWNVSKCKNMFGMFVDCDSMKELPNWCKK